MYSVTDAGSRGRSEVFTHGFTVDCRALDGHSCARSPAADHHRLGLDVLVQLVIAAMTTAPCGRSNSPRSSFTWHGLLDRGPRAFVLHVAGRRALEVVVDLGLDALVGAARGCRRQRLRRHARFDVGERDPVLRAAWGRTIGRDDRRRGRGLERGGESSGLGDVIAVWNSPCCLAGSVSTSSICRLVARWSEAEVASASPRRPGKKPIVAPYSGPMFAIVARSAQAHGRELIPLPKNSTNFPTTPCARSICDDASASRSVAVAPARQLRPTRLEADDLAEAAS